MKKELLINGFPYIGWTCFGLVLFMTVFFGVIIWVRRKGSNELYQDISQMPLN